MAWCFTPEEHRTADFSVRLLLEIYVFITHFLRLLGRAPGIWQSPVQCLLRPWCAGNWIFWDLATEPCLVFWGTCFASVHGALRESRPPDPEVHPRPSLQSCDLIAFAGVFNAPGLLSKPLVSGTHLFGAGLAGGADEKLEFLGVDFIWFSETRLSTYSSQCWLRQWIRVLRQSGFVLCFWWL